MDEHLVSQLQRIIQRHNVKTEIAVPKTLQLCSYQDYSNGCSSEDPTISYISRMLLDDHPESEKYSPSELQGLLHDFTSILSNDSPQSNESVGTMDLHWKLMQCARAVATNNISGFYEITKEIEDATAPTERAIHYFIEALKTKLTGAAGGSQSYRALAASISTRRIFNIRLACFPSFRAPQVFANEYILRACRESSEVHIVDFGIYCGYQWPYLIEALSVRPERPPKLRITGIEFPDFPEATETQHRLTEFANSQGVYLEYHQIFSRSWETARINLFDNETLIINCNLRLRHLKDEFVDMNNPRKILFERIYQMKPKLFVPCVANAALSTPFFLPRFEEALSYYQAKLEYQDAWLRDDVQKRKFMDDVVAMNIMNVVACEGSDRIERLDTYKNWDLRARKAGFEPVVLDKEVYDKVREIWGGFKYNENFRFGRDGEWMLLGWKEQVMCGLSAWKPLLR